MKVSFDTSVLVAAVVDQLANHEAAFECFFRYTSASHECFCSTHSIAECYATLTALPLKRRIHSGEARHLIAENFVNRLTILEIKRRGYLDALRRVADLGMISGGIYDALHLGCAEHAGCKRLYTYNLAEFRRLQPQGIVVTAP